MKILLVHGIGHSDSNPDYYVPWEEAIKKGFKVAGMNEPEFVRFHYDDIFEKHYSGPGTYANAIVQLLSTAAYHAVADPLAEWWSGLFKPAARDFTYGGDTLRWFPGMVAQLVTEGDLQKELRNHLADTLQRERPDMIAAHSLGSLLTFDFLNGDKRAKDFTALTYLTFGSQINNDFVRSRMWPGRIMMPGVKFWYHLFNPQDPVFTAEINLPDVSNFQQITAGSAAGHAATADGTGPGYLDNPATQAGVYNQLARAGTRALVRRGFAAVNRALAPPQRRALIIGINNYPDPANRLEGCVNDAFLFSSLLQERGYKPEEIRMVLDERATASAIRERLKWLLEDAGDGMERVLFYSGHGAQLPGYNAAEQVDHVDECLVPYDFAWTKETAIVDDDFYRLYSDLPFSAKFYAVFDCCHAGGMTRDGSRKARGIAPPDDIRHRMLKWNAKEQMWQERDWSSQSLLNANYGGSEEERRKMMGSNGVTYRLGRGMRLRSQLSKTRSAQLAKEKRALYLPVLMEACGEGQLSYEYRHGTVSYGAFTYSLVKNLRSHPGVTFHKLLEATKKSLQELGYDQLPQIVAPSAVLKKPVP